MPVAEVVKGIARRARRSEHVPRGERRVHRRDQRRDAASTSAASYVILGHSERRHILGETDADVNKKTLAALAAGLMPIVCVGELLAEREAGQTAAVIRRQFDGSLADVSAEQIERVVIAYEPVWAIGTGKVATPEQAEEVHADLRRLLAERYNERSAGKVRILYGGSVKAEQCRRTAVAAEHRRRTGRRREPEGRRLPRHRRGRVRQIRNSVPARGPKTELRQSRSSHSLRDSVTLWHFDSDHGTLRLVFRSWQSFLILLVLVQRGRGGGLAGALGGMGGSSAFGAKAGDVFTRITIVTASIWIVVCLVAVFWAKHQRRRARAAAESAGSSPARCDCAVTPHDADEPARRGHRSAGDRPPPNARPPPADRQRRPRNRHRAASRNSAGLRPIGRSRAACRRNR